MRKSRFTAEQMAHVLKQVPALLATLRCLLLRRSALHAEVLALRHQLLVLERQLAGTQVRLRPPDRLLWAWLSRI